MTKFAQPEEIQYAHSILLKNKPYFEQDKIDIIECNDSRDVKACPGSGKTTTLLAKLIILANRMPLPYNQGICVLTHTNVAIDEIKSKLGHKADILFNYPNHFGTIQSFVDKYLAIPALKKYFNTEVRIIDNDAANKFILSEFHKLNKYGDKLHSFLYNKFYEKFNLISSEEISSWEADTNDNELKQKLISSGIFNLKGEKVEKIYLDKNKSNWRELCNLIQEINIRKIVDDKKKEINNLIDLEKDKHITNLMMDYVHKNIYFGPIQFGFQCESGKSFVRLKENSFAKGILSFSDAYSLAFRYCNDNKENLKNAFSSRFKYVFIDEMQDTDRNQLDIINSIFDSNKTIIQCFGDHHQAIFNKIKPGELWEPSNALEINGSKRFGENIAKVLRSVCLEKNDALVANPTISSLSPIIIVFDNPKNVLPKFCELIQTKEVDSKTIWDKSKEEKIRIKAIGWVGNSDVSTRSADNLTIKSYFPTFNKNIKKEEKVDYNSIKSFLRKQDGLKVKDYSNKIIEALLQVLSIVNKKYQNGRSLRFFTKTSLLDYFSNKSIEDFNLFNSYVAKWAKSIHNSDGYCDVTIEEIKSFITSKFSQIFEFDATNKYIYPFLNNQPTDIPTDEEIKNNNIFSHNGIEVEVATIHSVKGETHTATLYLETSYEGKHESERIMEQLKGKYYVSTCKSDVYKKETLKMTHVGMSRSKYLLCMAIHRDRFDDKLDINNGGIWEIVNA